MRKPEEIKVMIPCDMCGASFQFGPHRYDGKYIGAYKLTVCKTCFEANWDGWSPAYERRLEKHLRKNGIALPARNQLGHYQRGD